MAFCFALTSRNANSTCLAPTPMYTLMSQSRINPELGSPLNQKLRHTVNLDVSNVASISVLLLQREA